MRSTSDPRFCTRVNEPATIRDLAARVGVTHSAASQTVAQMARAG
ncbi:MarR family transcriptional regulator [Micromonospora fulviviridis]|uniref:MarR family transcriptional regulator n=1 Tax=Micromonospora fulviviridis TaxID=47860 RepID=A0ABV2VFZ8_9ACTN